MHQDLLARAAPLFRCPRCHGDLAPGNRALGCRACGHAISAREGFLDFLDRPVERLSLGQRWFLSPLGARLYARFREGPAARVLGGKSFSEEVAWLRGALAIEARATVLDVPCGQGNFTTALAREAGDALVVAIDLSPAMLSLARARADREGLRNVVFVRASALDLPLRDGEADAVSTCGGLHLYPDVPTSIAEMRRVSRAGGRVAGLTFLAHEGRLGARVDARMRTIAGVRAFDFDALGEEFVRAGFVDFHWEGRALVAWFAARAG